MFSKLKAASVPLFRTVDQTQGLGHARLELYHRAASPAASQFLWSELLFLRVSSLVFSELPGSVV